MEGGWGNPYLSLKTGSLGTILLRQNHTDRMNNPAKFNVSRQNEDCIVMIKKKKINQINLRKKFCSVSIKCSLVILLC